MEFRVLGPVVVLGDGGTPLDIGPSQQRAVLALCVLAAPRPVSTARIVDALWEQEPPPGAVNTVQAYVSKLRRVLEPGRVRRAKPSVLVSRPGGYAVELPPESFDLGRAQAAVAAGRRLLEAGDHAGAAGRLRLALAEWRGEPLAGFEEEPWARDEIAHLAELRLAIVEDVAQAELALGLGRALVPELTRLVTAHPLRERLRRLGAHALYQAGRQADALALLSEGRRLLVGELGLDPDPGSRELEQRILAQDPALTPPPAAPHAPAPAAVVSPAAPAAEADPDSGPREEPGRPEGALIGRAAESAALRRAVAADGTRVVLVAGEPGIGKTSLAEDAAAHAPVAVFGRCWDGTGAPPFWPWAQAVRHLTGRHGELAEMLGATGEFALYDAFARLVAEHAAAHGRVKGRVLVVLDDLQWADASSLRLLEFLATTRACPDLTVIATYRDTEVGGPLARTLATLVRLPHVERITLDGLGEEAIAEYLRRAGADATRAAEVARRTGGNPFFLGELVHLDGGEAPGAVADVLRGRMAAMPPGASGVLSAAALLGRDAPLDVLLDVVRDVMDVPRDEVLDVLDAAVRARLLTEHDLVYRFAHDIVRDVLRDGLAPLRRRRLHAGIAAVLERRGTHLAELAHHYREGLVISGMAAKAIEYARQAAAHAMAQFAYEDAAEHLRHAVALTAQLPVTDRELRCDLLLELAEAQSAAGMSTQVHATLEEAAEIADALGDDDRLARAALGFSDPLSWAMYEEWAAGGALTGRIERALRGQGEGSPWRSQLLAAFAITGSFTRPVEESVALAAEAVREARGRGDDGPLLRALSAYEILSRGVAGQAGRQAAIDEMTEVARRTGDLVAEWLAREAEHVELVKQGELERAARLLTWLSDTARRIRQPALLSLTAWLSAIHAHLRGDTGRALAEAEESARLHPEGAMGRDHAESRAAVFRCLAARARGDAAAALALAEEAPARRPGEPGWRVLRCAVLLDLGRRDEALEVFAGLAADGFARMRGDLAYRFIPDLLSEACLALRDTAAAPVLHDLLLPHRGRLLGWSVTDLCLARLALVRDDGDTARRHLRDALALVRRSGVTLYEKPILALLARV
ncbi:BTAD domain-containing putative transcriptional regulator [Microbispora sp. ZYX-F-249]|uniref:BTAD domain-containing putative transcriptional regulator n=1 Tax=Microbispora maris TaxID=3144104 RepID=A0ABV0ANE9_9ACTN